MMLKTTTATILWMVFAAAATEMIRPFSKAPLSPLSVHAMDSSERMLRKVVKDRIEYVGPLVFEERITIGDDDFVDIAPNHPSHYHFHYERIRTRDAGNNRRNRNKDAHCDGKESKKSKGAHDYSDCPPAPAPEMPPTSTPQSSPEPSAAATTPEHPSSGPSTGTFLSSRSPSMATTIAPTTSTIPLVSPSVLPSLPPSSYRPTGVTSASSKPFTATPAPTMLVPNRNITDDGDEGDDNRNKYFLEHENRDGADTNAAKDSIGSSSSSGNTGWIIGGAAVIFIAAFCGGIATRNVCSKKNLKKLKAKTKTKNQNKDNNDGWRHDPETATGGVGNNSTKDWESDSIQFSVEESVDSYHVEDCDNWSVSVMSWSPNRNANPESIEIGLSMSGMPSGDGDKEVTTTAARPDEIEIEFIDDLEGYGNALEGYGHEEIYGEEGDEEEDSPRTLFSVVDLSGERMASF